MTRPLGYQNKWSVLVFDEDRRIADSLAFALDIFGFRATTAYTSQQALEFAATQSFQFVVSDLSQRTDGLETVLAIGDLLPDSKVLLLTGNGNFSHLVEQARSKGPRFEAFPRPVHPQLLIDKLREGGIDRPYGRQGLLHQWGTSGDGVVTHSHEAMSRIPSG